MPSDLRPTPARLKLTEIADRIGAHLRRFETDPTINVARNGLLKPFYMAGAWAAGSRVFVRYVSFQGASSLTKTQAGLYLARLDAGHVGKHWDVIDARHSKGDAK